MRCGDAALCQITLNTCSECLLWTEQIHKMSNIKLSKC